MPSREFFRKNVEDSFFTENWKTQKLPLLIEVLKNVSFSLKKNMNTGKVNLL